MIHENYMPWWATVGRGESSCAGRQEGKSLEGDGETGGSMICVRPNMVHNWNHRARRQSPEGKRGGTNYNITTICSITVGTTTVRPQQSRTWNSPNLLARGQSSAKWGILAPDAVDASSNLSTAPDQIRGPGSVDRRAHFLSYFNVLPNFLPNFSRYFWQNGNGLYLTLDVEQSDHSW